VWPCGAKKTYYAYTLDGRWFLEESKYIRPENYKETGYYKGGTASQSILAEVRGCNSPGLGRREGVGFSLISMTLFVPHFAHAEVAST